MIHFSNKEEFDLIQEWLSENFGSNLPVGYRNAIVGVTNTDCYGKICNYIMWLEEKHSNRPHRHEIKMNYELKISSIDWPKVKTLKEKRLQELRATIESAAKQIEELENDE